MAPDKKDKLKEFSFSIHFVEGFSHGWQSLLNATDSTSIDSSSALYVCVVTTWSSLYRKMYPSTFFFSIR